MMRSKKFLTCRRFQSGLSLIELMVSLVIGMVMVIFVTAMYGSSRSSYRLSDDNMRINQEGQAILHLIGRNVMQAQFGHMVPNARFSDFSGQGLHGCDKGFSNPTTFVEGVSATCAASGVSALEVSYRVDDTVNANIGAGTDCNGQTVPVNANGRRVAVNRFYLSTPSGETRPTLYCAGNGGAVAQPLLANVEIMHLTYGVDTDGDRSPDRFETSATTVTGLTSDWSNVISVRVCLEVASPNNVTPDAQTYTGCGGTQKTAADRRLRTVLSNTFTLRNHSKASPII